MKSASGNVPLSFVRIDPFLDNLLRRTSYGILNAQGALLASASFSYGSDDGRLQTVSSGSNSATYSYLANSPLVDHIIFQQNGTDRMATTNTFDNLTLPLRKIDPPLLS
jgi:hypothetical protein